MRLIKYDQDSGMWLEEIPTAVPRLCCCDSCPEHSHPTPTPGVQEDFGLHHTDLKERLPRTGTFLWTVKDGQGEAGSSDEEIHCEILGASPGVEHSASTLEPLLGLGAGLRADIAWGSCPSSPWLPAPLKVLLYTTGLT